MIDTIWRVPIDSGENRTRSHPWFFSVLRGSFYYPVKYYFEKGKFLRVLEKHFLDKGKFLRVLEK